MSIMDFSIKSPKMKDEGQFCGVFLWGFRDIETEIKIHTAVVLRNGNEVQQQQQACLTRPSSASVPVLPSRRRSFSVRNFFSSCSASFSFLRGKHYISENLSPLPLLFDEVLLFSPNFLILPENIEIYDFTFFLVIFLSFLPFFPLVISPPYPPLLILSPHTPQACRH